MFDTYVMVDWSAATVPRTGRDSIWICWHAKDGERLENPPTRHAAKLLLGEWLAAALAQRERVLLGFDFPFGYPAGFAGRLGLSGPPWRALWDEIARLLQDDEHNVNNRFDVANALNQRVSGRRFPFWGCPQTSTRDHLGGKHHRGHEPDGLAERRIVDLHIPSAQPCWKLLGAGSVGGQALTGIPVVRALRDDPRWAGQARIWPFETGLQAPTDGSLLIAEVYPSLWAVSPMAGEPKDAAQVRAVARYFAERDRCGQLTELFAGDPDLTPQQRDRVESEEAWTLGVTAAKQRPIAVPTFAANTAPTYSYLRDPEAIARRSFALIRQDADLDRFPRLLQPLALRLAQTAGDCEILSDLAWSRGAISAGRRALAAGAAILVDAMMVAAGITSERLAAGNPIICTLRDPETTRLAAAQGTTRSAAAVELWRPNLAGAVVAIGNAPTALFRLLEMLAEGTPKPALVLGFPVGFVSAAEAKAALAAFGHGLQFITLNGRRGGSALAAASVNALASAG
jgi:precorrin-8X/cobalt-precorrin-8 methylmutase